MQLSGEEGRKGGREEARRKGGREGERGGDRGKVNQYLAMLCFEFLLTLTI